MDSKKNKIKNIIFHIFSVIVSLGVLTGIVWIVAWIGLNVHPGNQAESRKLPTAKLDLAGDLFAYSEESRFTVLADYLSNNQVKKKIYKIADGEIAPAPHQSCYGSYKAGEAKEMEAVIEEARSIGILEGQDIAFSPDATFWGNCTIHYYLDETIFVVVWKELVHDKAISFAEVKIADPSQFGRKLVDDKYGSGKQMFCSALAKQSNAVLATNADYYAFRNLGITCFESTIYRTEDSLDTLFIDENGDFILYDRRQKRTKEELQSYVDENNIRFGLSFGPIMVRDGVAVENGNYPIGQTTEIYSRFGIGQMDRLHYLFVNVENHGEGRRPCTVNDYALIMVEKGVKQGYNLDGGQTGEIVIKGNFYNFVDYGNERDVSDIIYFTTALPDSEIEE